MKLLFIFTITIGLAVSCKSQVSPKSSSSSPSVVNQVNADDCRVKAALISLEPDNMTVEIKVLEVLEVGFGFQSALYKGQEVSILYLQKIENEVKSFQVGDEFIGIITSELSFGDSASLKLTSIEK